MNNVNRLQPMSLLIMRVAAGAIVLDHGIRKFQFPGFAGYLQFQHMPAWLNTVAAGFEVVVGALLIVGLLTKWAAIGTALYMVVAAVLAHPVGHLLQEPAMLFALAAGLLAFGPGMAALDRMIGKTA